MTIDLSVNMIQPILYLLHGWLISTFCFQYIQLPYYKAQGKHTDYVLLISAEVGRMHRGSPTTRQQGTGENMNK